ncbi:MAG: hypothetical protein VW493_09440 [Gammaproteobacteria bacterium]
MKVTVRHVAVIGIILAVAGLGLAWLVDHQLGEAIRLLVEALLG